MSITLEDTLNDYENNSLCKISSMLQGCCNYITKYKCIVHSLENNRRKIKKTLNENLQIKHYIKIGEECSICYEGIFTKKNAFLTDCGHSFHYSCIIKYDYINSFKDAVYCPLCRQDMGGYMDLKDKYIESSSFLDKLEDFELNKSFKLPKVCYNITHYTFNDHFFRLKYKSCKYCRL